MSDTSNDRYELAFRYRGRWIRGTYVLRDGMVIARSEDGRTKPTQIGGSVGAEETLARILLRELAEEGERIEAAARMKRRSPSGRAKAGTR